MHWVKMEPSNLPLQKFMKDEEMNALIQAMDGQPETFSSLEADKDSVVFDVLGIYALRLVKIWA